MKYKIVGGRYDGAHYASPENLPYGTKLILGTTHYILTPNGAEPIFIAQKDTDND